MGVKHEKICVINFIIICVSFVPEAKDVAFLIARDSKLLRMV